MVFNPLSNGDLLIERTLLYTTVVVSNVEGESSVHNGEQNLTVEYSTMCREEMHFAFM